MATTKRTRRASNKREVLYTLSEALGMRDEWMAVTENARGETVGIFESAGQYWAACGWNQTRHSCPLYAAQAVQADSGAHIWRRREVAY